MHWSEQKKRKSGKTSGEKEQILALDSKNKTILVVSNQLCVATGTILLALQKLRTRISHQMSIILCWVCYQASVDKRSQREIADVAGVADVTIRLKERVPLFVFCCTRQNLCVFFWPNCHFNYLWHATTAGKATSWCYRGPVSSSL